MIPKEKLAELEQSIQDYMESAVSDLHLIVKEDPYMAPEQMPAAFPQKRFNQMSQQLLGIDNVLWAGKRYGVPECPPEYKKLITERCVGKTVAEIIREYDASSVFPKTYTEVDGDFEEMKKQILKDHWPAVYIFAEEEREAPGIMQLPFRPGGKVLHSGADFQILDYAAYATGIRVDDLWEFFFKTPEGKQMFQRAVAASGARWVPAQAAGTPGARSQFGTEKVRYGELSISDRFNVTVIAYSSLGGVLKDQKNYQDDVVFKLGRYEDNTPEELLEISNPSVFGLAKYLWNRKYVEDLDAYWPQLPGVDSKEESRQRGAKIGPALKADLILAKHYERARAAMPQFFTKPGSRVLQYGFTLNQLILQDQSQAPSRILRLKSGDLYELALMLYQKKMVVDRMTTIDIKDFNRVATTSAFQGITDSSAVRQLVAAFPEGFSIYDIESFDSDFQGGGKRPQFPDEVHNIQQLRLGTDLRVAVKKISISQRAFPDSPNFAFQLIWTTMRPGSLPSTEAEASQEYNKGFTHTLKTYPYGPNTHFDTGTQEPDSTFNRVHIKDGIVLAWIRFTVIAEQECVVIDEIQTDMTNKEYEFMLGADNKFMQGWEHLIMKYFLNYARKNLHYQKVYAPTPQAKVGRYKAMATVPVLNNLYSSLWDDFAFNKQPETQGPLKGFRLLNEHRAHLIDIERF